MKISPKEVGRLVRETRKSIGVTQQQLALTSGSGLRFISDLENGKVTCEIGKVLMALQTLGIKIELIPPNLSSLQGVDKN